MCFSFLKKGHFEVTPNFWTVVYIKYSTTLFLAMIRPYPEYMLCIHCPTGGSSSAYNKTPVITGSFEMNEESYIYCYIQCTCTSQLTSFNGGRLELCLTSHGNYGQAYWFMHKVKCYESIGNWRVTSLRVLSINDYVN